MHASICCWQSKSMQEEDHQSTWESPEERPHRMYHSLSFNWNFGNSWLSCGLFVRELQTWFTRWRRKTWSRHETSPSIGNCGNKSIDIFHSEEEEEEEGKVATETRTGESCEKSSKTSVLYFRFPFCQVSHSQRHALSITSYCLLPFAWKCVWWLFVRLDFLCVERSRSSFCI